MLPLMLRSPEGWTHFICAEDPLAEELLPCGMPLELERGLLVASFCGLIRK